MIKIVFFGEKELLRGFEAKGHALYSRKKDVLCAAVSALTTHTAKALNERFKNLRIYEQEKGYMKLEILNTADVLSQEMLKALVDSLRDLQERFPKHISVEVKIDGT
ncbi:MAG: ribosomal-processing cysteine protease Prp [Thermotogae bacterium]|nr:ribosomal-processing cysteine protease Prp [Thermotogota bacterium]